MNKERWEGFKQFLSEQSDSYFDMGYWQWCKKRTLAKTIEKLHKCGNTACIAGYLALWDSFIKDGGRCSRIGAPIYQGEIGSYAFAKYFEISSDAANLLTQGYEDGWEEGYSVENWHEWTLDNALDALNIVEEWGIGEGGLEDLEIQLGNIRGQ